MGIGIESIGVGKGEARWYRDDLSEKSLGSKSCGYFGEISGEISLHSLKAVSAEPLRQNGKLIEQISSQFA